MANVAALKNRWCVFTLMAVTVAVTGRGILFLNTNQLYILGRFFVTKLQVSMDRLGFASTYAS